MGLFSFFKKKPQAPDPAPATRLRAGEPSRLATEAERARQREIARATAAKIDEIELAMTSDIFDEPAWGSAPRSSPAAGAAAPPETAVAIDLPDAAATPDAAPAAEESAILYANGQAPAAEQLLRAWLGGAGRAERLPWWMLFDLYQATGQEAAFESIAIDYASHFETSPPAFNPLAQPREDARAVAGVAPSATLAGVLDEASVAGLAPLLCADPASPLVRLDFGAVRAATPGACASLLELLRTARADGRELVLAGAGTLVAVLRPLLAVGERSASQAPWLLLLELLQLMNCEKDFEETAMDYCVTFEVSPPSFEAPRHAASAPADPAAAPGAGERFLLPPLLAGECGDLLAAVDAYGAGHDPVVLDCSRLARIDYACAGALHARLRALAAAGRTVELRDLNHLVATLFRLLGSDGLRLFAHRY